MPNVEEVAALLRSGKNVVTPSAGSIRAKRRPGRWKAAALPEK